MIVRLLLSTLFILTTSTLAQFASLTIHPNGDSLLDITTNITTLPQGGEIIDKGRGITLKAEQIEYQDGVYIKAQGAVAEGFFGRLSAPNFYLDTTQNIIGANGSVTLSQNGLSLSADNLQLDLSSGIVTLSGNVSNQSPSFQAATLVLKLGAGYALMVAPFNYQDILVKEEPGSLAQLNQTREADNSFSYRLSTTLDEAIRVELTPYIP